MRRCLTRSFHWSGIRRGIEDYEQFETMLSTGYSPPGNTTVTKEYKVPAAVLSSWVDQRRGVGPRFRDVAVIKLRSGDGGDGKISFLRSAGRATGPPDGGDGGAGGHVFVQAIPGLTSLHHLRHIYKASNGRSGGSSQLAGRRGENVILQVPVGTRVYWCPPIEVLRTFRDHDISVNVDVITNLSRFDRDAAIQLRRTAFKDGLGGWLFKEKEEEKWMETPAFRKLVQSVHQFDMLNRRAEMAQDSVPFGGFDLATAGEPVRLLSGGAGGLGNIHFQTAELRSPSFSKRGRYGLEETFIFELQLLADLGLVGLPNAGKSTLLRAISRARPEVGDWEFTTLAPSVGTINLGPALPSFTVADIPGILEGAKEGKGRGLGFLRHVERSGGLVFVIGLDSSDPVRDLNILESELGQARMKNKRILVVATKADSEGSESRFRSLETYSLNKGFDIIPCSAQEGSVEGVIQCMGRAAGIL